MESPEGKALQAEGVELGSVASVIHYGLRYEDVTIADMTDEQFDIVLFEVIPRKMMVQPDEAAEIVREALAFWAFLGREYGLEHPASCAAIVAGDRAVTRLQVSVRWSAVGGGQIWPGRCVQLTGAAAGSATAAAAA